MKQKQLLSYLQCFVPNRDSGRASTTKEEQQYQIKQTESQAKVASMEIDSRMSLATNVMTQFIITGVWLNSGHNSRLITKSHAFDITNATAE